MKLTIKQTAAIDLLEDQTTRQIVFGGGAGGGKSALGCYWILKGAIKYPGTRWFMGREIYKDFRDTTLKTFHEVALDIQGLPGEAYHTNENLGYMRFHNGSEILMRGLRTLSTDPEHLTLGSLELTGAFIDEAGEVTAKAKNILFSRIRYKLDENNLVPKLLMTCNPSHNFIYREFYQPSRTGYLDPSKAFVPALVDDNPHISKHYKESLGLLDAVSRRRLRDGSWDFRDEDAVMFSLSKINDIYSNSFLYDPERDHGEGRDPRYMSVDVARFGEDSTAILIWSGLTIRGVKVIPKSSTTVTAATVRDLAERHGVARSRIVIDEDGVGGGVVDALPGVIGFENGSRPINGENYKNLKTQCYYKAAELVAEGAVYVRPDVAEMILGEGSEFAEQLTRELQAVQRGDVKTLDGKKTINAKADQKEILGHSPDLADAFMMRAYFEVQGEGGFGIAGSVSRYQKTMT